MTLGKLIEAVEIGNEAAAKLEARKLYPDHAPDMGRAFNGSLDAANRLHDALLPGWVFDITNGSALVMPQSPWDVPDDVRGDDYPQWSAESDVDARAWLLAILRAMEGGEDG